jgi:hypothetical protein
MDADHGWLQALELDIDALAQAETDLDRDAEVAERIRIERSAIGLLDRLPAAGVRIEVRTRLGQRIAGPVVAGAQDWLIIESAADVHALIPKHAVAWIRTTGTGVRPGGIVHSRSLSSVFREWARDRANLRIHLSDRSEIVGRLVAAYADHVDVLTADQGTYSIAFTGIELASRGAD